MGIASLILGIAAVVMAFIPCPPCWPFLPIVAALVGLALGIIEMHGAKPKTDPKRKLATAGTLLNTVAIAIILIWVVVMVLVPKKATTQPASQPATAASTGPAIAEPEDWKPAP